MALDRRGPGELSREEEADSRVEVRQVGNAQEQTSAGLQDSCDLAQRSWLIQKAHVLEHVEAERGVEGAAVEWEREKIGPPDVRGLVGRVHSEDVPPPPAVALDEGALARPDVEDLRTLRDLLERFIYPPELPDVDRGVAPMRIEVAVVVAALGVLAGCGHGLRRSARRRSRRSSSCRGESRRAPCGSSPQDRRRGSRPPRPRRRRGPSPSALSARSRSSSARSPPGSFPRAEGYPREASLPPLCPRRCGGRCLLGG